LVDPLPITSISGGLSAVFTPKLQNFPKNYQLSQKRLAGQLFSMVILLVILFLILHFFW
jgi:hypothetical protein